MKEKALDLNRTRSWQRDNLSSFVVVGMWTTKEIIMMRWRMLEWSLSVALVSCVRSTIFSGFEGVAVASAYIHRNQRLRTDWMLQVP